MWNCRQNNNEDQSNSYMHINGGEECIISRRIEHIKCQTIWTLNCSKCLQTSNKTTFNTFWSQLRFRAIQRELSREAHAQKQHVVTIDVYIDLTCQLFFESIFLFNLVCQAFNFHITRTCYLTGQISAHITPERYPMFRD